MAKALPAVHRDGRDGGKNNRRGGQKQGRGGGSHVAARGAFQAAPTFTVAAAEVQEEQDRQRPRWRPTNREACQKKASTAFALWLQRHKGEWHRPSGLRLRRKTSVFRPDLMHLKFASLEEDERLELEVEAAIEKEVNEQKRQDLKSAQRLRARARARGDAAGAAVAAETPVVPLPGALSSSLSVVHLAVASFSPVAEEEPSFSSAVEGGQSFRWHETSGISRSVWLPQDAMRLGAGCFGSVFLVRDMQSEALLALKLPSGRDVGEEGAALQSEWCLFRRARHENIVCCLGLCVGSAAGSIGIVLEAADGSLWQWILERRSKQEASPRLGGGASPRRGGGADAIEAIERGAIAQLGRGLAHLHACSIVHLDIKPENMLVQSGRDASDRETLRFMISDLGNAFDLEGSPVREAAVAAMGVGRSGSRGAARPFVLARLVQSPQYRPACCFEAHEVRCGPYLDVWAFACVVFEVVARNWEATRSGRHLRLQGGVREDWSAKDVHALRNRRLSSCCHPQITPLILAAQGRHFSASTVSNILKDLDSVLQRGDGRGGGSVTAPGALGAAVAAPAVAVAAPTGEAAAGPAMSVTSSDSD